MKTNIKILNEIRVLLETLIDRAQAERRLVLSLEAAAEHAPEIPDHVETVEDLYCWYAAQGEREKIAECVRRLQSVIDGYSPEHGRLALLVYLWSAKNLG